MRKAILVLRWILRLAVLGLLAYVLHPLYAPPKPTLPAAIGAEDHVTWTLRQDTNVLVFQSFTVYGDGRNVVLISRPPADPDLPELDAHWKITRNRQSGVHELRRESVLTAEQAKTLLQSALEAGALDVEDEAALPTETLEIETVFSGVRHMARGPAHAGVAVHTKPQVWLNRMRWQRLGRLLRSDPRLYELLLRREVLLVDDTELPRP